MNPTITQSYSTFRMIPEQRRGRHDELMTLTQTRWYTKGTQDALNDTLSPEPKTAQLRHIYWCGWNYGRRHLADGFPSP